MVHKYLLEVICYLNNNNNKNRNLIKFIALSQGQAIRSEESLIKISKDRNVSCFGVSHLVRLSFVLKYKTDTMGNELVAPGNNVGKQSFSTGVSSKHYKKYTYSES